MKFNSKRRPCCDILHGLDVVRTCDNCGTVVVERDAGKHTVQCIDSVKASKALKCVEELAKLEANKSILDASDGGDWGWGWAAGFNDCITDTVAPVLKKYGFME